MFKFWFYISLLSLISGNVYLLRCYALFGDRIDNKKHKSIAKRIFPKIQLLFMCLFPIIHILFLFMFVYLIFENYEELERRIFKNK